MQHSPVFLVSGRKKRVHLRVSRFAGHGAAFDDSSIPGTALAVVLLYAKLELYFSTPPCPPPVLQMATQQLGGLGGQVLRVPRSRDWTAAIPGEWLLLFPFWTAWQQNLKTASETAKYGQAM